MVKCCEKERSRKNHQKHLVNKHGIIIKSRTSTFLFKCKYCRKETTDEQLFNKHKEECKKIIFPTRMGKINKLLNNVFIYNNNL